MANDTAAGQPCIPGGCPLVHAVAQAPFGGIPANPFLAEITAGGLRTVGKIEIVPMCVCTISTAGDVSLVCDCQATSVSLKFRIECAIA